MAESKIARNARLKAMRRKYGLGEFKKSGSSAPRRNRRRSAPMARKRKGRSSSSSGGGNIQIMDVAIAGGYGYFTNDIDGMLGDVYTKVPGDQYAPMLVKGGAAYLLNKFNLGGPMVKKATKVIVLCEAYNAGKTARS